MTRRPLSALDPASTDAADPADATAPAPGAAPGATTRAAPPGAGHGPPGDGAHPAGAIAQVDVTGRFVAASDRFCELLGRARHELLALRMQDVTHADDLPRNLPLFGRALATGEPFEIEKRYVRPDGSAVWVRNSVSAVRDRDGRVAALVTFSTDLTERRRAESALRLLAAAGAALTASRDYASTLRAAAELAVPSFARWCMVFVVDEGGALRALATTCAVPGKGALVEAMARRLAQLPAGDRHAVRRALDARAPYVAAPVDAAFAREASADAEYRRLFDALAPTALVAVPLMARDHAHGVLLFVTDEPGARYDAADVELAAELARRAAVAVDAAALFEAEQRARRAAERAGDRARRLQRLATALGGAVTTEAVADIVVHAGLEAVDAAAASLAVLDARGATLTLVAEEGYSPDVAERFRSFAVDERAPVGRAALRGEPTFLESLAAMEVEFPQTAATLRRTGFQAYVALPVSVGGRPVAAVSLSFRTQRAFDEGERGFLLTLAALAGQALERARLFDSERQAREAAEEAAGRTVRLYREKEAAEQRLAFLAQASGALSESLDFRTTLETVARLTIPHLADWCVVDIATPDGSVDMVAVAHVDPSKVETAHEYRRRFPPDPQRPGGVLHVIRTGQPEMVPAITDAMLARSLVGAAGAEERLALARAVAPRSYICVPMIARGRTLGAITLLRTADSGRRYGPDDLADVQELARRAALAVDNARLFDEAERAGRARSDFLAVMSHELRTPLNAVLGYAGLLGDGITGPVSEAQRTQLGRIQASARHLLLLVDEVLTLARLEAGTQQVLREPTDLFAVVQETVHLVEPSAAMRGLRLALEGPGERITVSTDPTKLRQVLLNLLSNAAKFTVLGGITVRVSAPPADGDGAAQACVAVTDTGPGIAPEHLDRIFEPFFQVEQRHTRLVGGTGLGLAVSRRLARLLGGDVVVSSAPGAGSTFTICLPVLADGDGAGGAGDAA